MKINSFTMAQQCSCLQQRRRACEAETGWHFEPIFSIVPEEHFLLCLLFVTGSVCHPYFVAYLLFLPVLAGNTGQHALKLVMIVCAIV